MSLDPLSTHNANREFEQARFRAALGHVLAVLTRRSDELLSYQEVAERLNLSARTERGIQTIPVAAIVGSVGRSADFTRTFLPRRARDVERWARVRNAFLGPHRDNLPPIEVYKVGDAYFVLDGNHRVSVARNEGIEFIEAHVIELHTPIPFDPSVQPEDLIAKAEYADFLASTGLGSSELEFDLSVCEAGTYRKLSEQIAVHQVILGERENREVPYTEAASDWLENVYAPLVLAIREQHLADWFPDSCETDLYLWVSEHRQALEQELGWSVRPAAAVNDLAVRSSSRARSKRSAPGTWRQERLATRYLDRLFLDILVPVRDTADAWVALDQALVIADKERSRVHGLHVISGTPPSTAQRAHLQEKFQARCAAAHVQGELVFEKGSIVDKIRERATLTDLIVLNVAHAPQGRLTGSGAHWRAILNHSARPVLAVPRVVTPLRHAMVLLDGGPTSYEALFVATYMAEIWGTALTLLIQNDGTQASAAYDRARAYLEVHEVDAEFIRVDGPVSPFPDTLAARRPDVLLLGADGSPLWRQLVGTNQVNYLLARVMQSQSPCPLLICQ